jgi:hypothetical protein
VKVDCHKNATRLVEREELDGPAAGTSRGLGLAALVQGKFHWSQAPPDPYNLIT